LAYLIPKKSMQSLDARLRSRIGVTSQYKYEFIE
jgi:hypothetical protein